MGFLIDKSIFATGIDARVGETIVVPEVYVDGKLVVENHPLLVVRISNEEEYLSQFDDPDSERIKLRLNPEYKYFHEVRTD
jgi:hypothetical protein